MCQNSSVAFSEVFAHTCFLFFFCGYETFFHWSSFWLKNSWVVMNTGVSTDTNQDFILVKEAQMRPMCLLCAQRSVTLLAGTFPKFSPFLVCIHQGPWASRKCLECNWLNSLSQSDVSLVMQPGATAWGFPVGAKCSVSHTLQPHDAWPPWWKHTVHWEKPSLLICSRSGFFFPVLGGATSLFCQSLTSLALCASWSAEGAEWLLHMVLMLPGLAQRVRWKEKQRQLI